MAIQSVGIGSSANDGTGDPLRTAFTKINENFTEVYALLGQDTDGQKGIDISGSTIASTETNADIIIDPNGTGLVEIGADLQVGTGLKISGATLTSLATNSNITLTPSGTGSVVLDSVTITENQIAASNSNDDLQITGSGTGDVVIGAIRIHDTTLSADDSSAIKIAETLRVNVLTSDDSTAIQINDAVNISGAVALGGNLDVNTISSTDSAAIQINDAVNVSGAVAIGGHLDVNTISSNDSAGVVINDNLTIGGRLNTTGSTTLHIDGGLSVEGELQKDSGTFRIDHPLMPDTHKLVHSFVEGPRADNIYRGTVELTNGFAEVNLDDEATMTEGTWVALNRDGQAWVNNMTDWTPVKATLSGCTLTIEASDKTSNATVSWLVIGERQDPTIKQASFTDADGHVIVEPQKTIFVEAGQEYNI
jgi:hypothetical protein